MAVQKWNATWTSRGTVLTTELNTLAAAAWSAQGPSFDNTTNLDQFGVVYIVLGALSGAPAAGGTLSLYLAPSADGTNYDVAGSTTNGIPHQSQPGLILTIDSVNGNARNLVSGLFQLPTGKFKMQLLNSLSVNLAASGNTVTLYTTNLAIN